MSPLPPALACRLHVLSSRAAPAEACGLLLGRRDPLQIVEIVPLENPAPAGRFRIDPLAWIAAEEEARGRGLELLGPWHSHPGGDATPSQSDHDAAVAWPGTVWVIVGEVIEAWIASSDGLRPLGSDRGAVLRSAARQSQGGPQ